MILKIKILYGFKIFVKEKLLHIFGFPVNVLIGQDYYVYASLTRHSLHVEPKAVPNFPFGISIQPPRG